MHKQLSTKVVRHMVAPGFEQARAVPFVGETINEFLTRMEWDFKIPTICMTTTAPIMRKDWDSYPMDLGDIVFISRPHGGSGGNKMAQVAGIVGVIALAAVAPWAAGQLAPFLGITSSVGISALAGAISLGGAFLLSTLVKVNAGGQGDGLPDAGQVYSLSSAGNTGRPLDCIPVNYGRLKLVPDYGTSAWSEYLNNDQYLNLLLVVGVGKHNIYQILIDDTILWDSVSGLNPAFVNVDIQFRLPNEPVTLFPTNIQQSSEVSGQAFEGPSSIGGGWIGGFIANAAGTTAYRMVFDVALPQGLFQTDSDANPHQQSVTFEIEGRRVNDAGTPLEGYTPFPSVTITDMTRTPLRRSFPVDVTPGRWEFRMRRTSEPEGGLDGTVPQQGQAASIDQASWLGLRAYIQGSSTFEHEQVIAIRMKADSQLSNQSSRQFGVIATRILPVWNGSTFAEAETQNPFWAFLDAATNTLYGARRPLSKVDFQAIFDLATEADTRGDTFNYSFRSFVAVPAAFDTILASARSKHCWVGDVLSVVRDEWKPIPQMLLTDNQIVRGSLEVVSIFNDETGIDCVIGELLNENTWKPAELQYPPNTGGFLGTTPSRVRIEGITNPDQMYREIAFLYRQSQLRRTKVNISTEHDGRLLRLMSAVKVQSHLPQTWGIAGEVISSLGNVLTTTIEFPDYGETTYIELRDRRGRFFGPVKCFGVNGNTKKIELDSTDLALVESQVGMTLEDALERMDGAERPSLVVGKAGSMSRNCIVLSGRPSGDKVELSMVVDSYDVHGEDGIGPTPVPPPIPPTQNPAIPVVAALKVVFRMGIAEPMIDGSWWAAPGAVGYRAQISYNGGVNWQTIYDGIQPNFGSIPVEPLGMKVRVSAYNNVQGPWSVVDVEPPTVEVRPNTVTPESMIKGLHDYVMNQLNGFRDDVRNLQQLIASNGADADAASWLEDKKTRRQLTSVTATISADVTEVMEVATSTEAAFAAYSLTTTAQIGDLTASVTTNSTAIGNINGLLAAKWSVSININGSISGIELIAGTGSASTFTVQADRFQFQLPGYNGGLPTPFLSAGLIGGVPSLGINANLYLDGVIQARSLAVTSLSSITANIGTVTAGVLRSADGRMVIDLNNRQIIFYD